MCEYFKRLTQKHQNVNNRIKKSILQTNTITRPQLTCKCTSVLTVTCLYYLINSCHNLQSVLHLILVPCEDGWVGGNKLLCL